MIFVEERGGMLREIFINKGFEQFQIIAALSGRGSVFVSRLWADKEFKWF